MGIEEYVVLGDENETHYIEEAEIESILSVAFSN